MASSQQGNLDSTISRMVGDATAGVRAQAARATWMGTKMADLPDAYRQLMPTTEDAQVLARAEQDIRRSYRKDMAVHTKYHGGYAAVAGQTALHGLLATDVRSQLGMEQAAADQAYAAGNANAGQPVQQTAAAPIDLSSMSGMDLIKLGIKQSTPARGGGGARADARSMQPSLGPEQQLDYSKLSANQLINLGLRSSKPAR